MYNVLSTVRGLTKAAKPLILAIVIFLVSAIMGNVQKLSRADTPPLPLKLMSKGISISSWVWDSPSKFAPEADTKLDFAEKEGVSDLYLYVDDYIDLYELPDSVQKEEKIADFDNAVKEIIGKANKRNIHIYALSGNSNWAFDSHSYIPPIILKHVYYFNKENPGTTLKGIIFDIEFYNDKYFTEDTIYNTKSYLNLVSDLAKQTLQSNKVYNQQVELGFALPFWTDQASELVPTPLTLNVIDILNSVPKSKIVIMAYRNTIFGDDGVLAITQDKLNYADSKSVDIIIGQEIRDVDEKNVSLFGKNKSEIIQYVFDIAQNLINHKSFAGIAIHDFTAFQKLN